MTMIRIHKRILLRSILIFAFLGALYSDALSASRGPESIEWRLMEAGGTPIPPLANKRQPYILLDPVEKKAAGFSGCNNFFGSYELDGALLKFGPVGATRMFCEGESGEVEMRFMDALQQTRTWERRDGTLLLLKDGESLARFTIKQKDEQAPDLASMTFLSTWLPAGKVTLSQGEYREPAAPGSASEIIVRLSDKKAFGVINGRDAGAAVIFTSAGGTGTFYDLILLIREAEGWANRDISFLGDRVNLHAVEIKDDQIVVSMTMHGPSDPMCCPTLEKKKRFAVREDRLVPAAECEAEKESRIIGTVWQWVQTLYNDDRKNVPAKPENYTIQFLEDGKVNVKADCNLKGGVYSTDGKRFSLEITHSTMAACEEGSLEEAFVRDLTAGAIFFLKDGNLYLDLKYDTGTMKFSKKKIE